MTHPAEARCIELAATTGGVEVELDDERLVVESAELRAEVALPGHRPAKWDLLDFGRAIPGRPRGDQRETLLHYIVQDADDPGTPHPGTSLRQELGAEGVLPASDVRTRE